MSNRLYDKGRQALSDGVSINWVTDTIRAVLVNVTYPTDTVNHANLSDVSVGARIATSPPLTNKTNVAGVFDADDTLFSLVPAGPAGVAVILYKDTGVEATSKLIAYVDSASGLPVTPSGVDIPLRFDSGPNKIFKI
jgi:hypothetical protein